MQLESLRVSEAFCRHVTSKIHRVDTPANREIRPRASEFCSQEMGRSPVVVKRRIIDVAGWGGNVAMILMPTPPPGLSVMCVDFARLHFRSWPAESEDAPLCSYRGEYQRLFPDLK